MLIYTETDANHDKKYLELLSKGDLAIPSRGLGDFVSSGFAVLELCCDIIDKSKLPATIAEEVGLNKSSSNKCFSFLSMSLKGW